MKNDKKKKEIDGWNILLLASKTPRIPTIRVYDVGEVRVVEDDSWVASPWPPQEGWATPNHFTIFENKPISIIWVCSSLCCYKSCNSWWERFSDYWYCTSLQPNVTQNELVRFSLNLTHKKSSWVDQNQQNLFRSANSWRLHDPIVMEPKNYTIKLGGVPSIVPYSRFFYLLK